MDPTDPRAPVNPSIPHTYKPLVTLCCLHPSTHPPFTLPYNSSASPSPPKLPPPLFHLHTPALAQPDSTLPFTPPTPHSTLQSFSPSYALHSLKTQGPLQCTSRASYYSQTVHSRNNQGIIPQRLSTQRGRRVDFSYQPFMVAPKPKSELPRDEALQCVAVLPHERYGEFGHVFFIVEAAAGGGGGGTCWSK
ncbi:hypothetical protein P154DRAFT_624162 [Amniculicola lignicola CBS 123094]|uniref:Uncharacterized protein n=1 Tax=Amniculicola lignicola CBS 123094 TaxID=1392246 RepID=A0A6A5W7R7_9PLEO|nr:hypothetical protein P154DRAFT_624162 [Amniculicola lignicola CBS 123094]